MPAANYSEVESGCPYESLLLTEVYGEEGQTGNLSAHLARCTHCAGRLAELQHQADQEVACALSYLSYKPLDNLPALPSNLMLRFGLSTPAAGRGLTIDLRHKNWVAYGWPITGSSSWARLGAFRTRIAASATKPSPALVVFCRKDAHQEVQVSVLPLAQMVADVVITLHDIQGRPIEGQTVTLRREDVSGQEDLSARTSLHGMATFPGLQAGYYVLIHSGHQSVRIEVAPDTLEALHILVRAEQKKLPEWVRARAWQSFWSQYHQLLLSWGRTFLWMQTEEPLGDKDAEDVAQETVLAICQAMREGRFTADSKEKALAWLRKVAYRTVRDWAKKKRPQRGLDDTPGGLPAKEVSRSSGLASGTVPDEVADRELAGKVAASLDPEEKKAAELCIGDGHSEREAARLMDTNKSRVHRDLESIRRKGEQIAGQ